MPVLSVSGSNSCADVYSGQHESRVGQCLAMLSDCQHQQPKASLLNFQEAPFLLNMEAFPQNAENLILPWLAYLYSEKVRRSDGSSVCLFKR